jgi:uncharacterized membrane protein YsdA (DUF1294 family)
VVDVTSTGTIATKHKVKAKTIKSKFDFDAASVENFGAPIGKKKSKGKVVDVTSTGTIAAKHKVKAKTAKSEFDFYAAATVKAGAAIGKKKSNVSCCNYWYHHNKV